MLDFAELMMTYKSGFKVVIVVTPTEPEVSTQAPAVCIHQTPTEEPTPATAPVIVAQEDTESIPATEQIKPHDQIENKEKPSKHTKNKPGKRSTGGPTRKHHNQIPGTNDTWYIDDDCLHFKKLNSYIKIEMVDVLKYIAMSKQERSDLIRETYPGPNNRAKRWLTNSAIDRIREGKIILSTEIEQKEATDEIKAITPHVKYITPTKPNNRYNINKSVALEGVREENKVIG